MRFILFPLLAVLLLVEKGVALVPHHVASDTGTALFAAKSKVFKSRESSVGGGVFQTPPGNCALFDPDSEGLLQGTGDLLARIQQGTSFVTTTSMDIDSSLPSATYVVAPSAEAPSVQDAQHWLEDIGLPLNFAKPSKPATATILGRSRLIAPDAPGDIQHVLMKLPDGMHYVEGQSLSVIPDGVDAKTGRAHKPRLYSIASTRYGDLVDGNTISLCVRRAEYYDPVTGLIDPAKKGICSNFLCDISPGTSIQVAGPVGKTMLLPEKDDADIIMVATGTGIAPFRGFMHRLFMEKTLKRQMYTGNAWLILGVPTTGGLLYPEEFAAMQKNAPNALKIDYAISREMKNQQGGKLYVQHVLSEKADELWERLENGAVIYFCGLKGMMPGILKALEGAAIARGEDWPTKLAQLKANNQFHVEVY